MTDLRQAAKAVVDRWDSPKWEWSQQGPTADLMAALRTALEQPSQEPVAWAVQGITQMIRGEFAELDAKSKAKRIGGTCVAYPLYTAPPQRPWVGLTNKEIAEILCDDRWQMRPELMLLACQAKLKERNT
jgi:hypothetical protein